MSIRLDNPDAIERLVSMTQLASVVELSASHIPDLLTAFHQLHDQIERNLGSNIAQCWAHPSADHAERRLLRVLCKMSSESISRLEAFLPANNLSWGLLEM
jgi:hypothetical protein